MPFFFLKKTNCRFSKSRASFLAIFKLCVGKTRLCFSLWNVNLQARPLLMQALENGSFDGLVDPRMEEYDSFEMTQMVACAAACVRSSARRRPRMSQVFVQSFLHICVDTY